MMLHFMLLLFGIPGKIVLHKKLREYFLRKIEPMINTSCSQNIRSFINQIPSIFGVLFQGKKVIKSIMNVLKFWRLGFSTFRLITGNWTYR